MYIEDVLNLARSHIGFREGENNQNPFADDAETVKAYGGRMQNLPWCDIFVDYLFCKVFGADDAKRITYQRNGMSAACKFSADCYKIAGAYDHIPHVGDQIFFYANGDINHTGIVESVYDTQITTIEGNTSDGVFRRTYNKSDATIAGYGHPAWPEEQEEEILDEPLNNQKNSFKDWFEKIFGKPKTKPVDEQKKTYLHLSYGDGMNNPLDRVKVVQLLLNLHGAFLDADGEYGYQTQEAVKKFQAAHGLEVSGEIDGLVWEELILFSTEEKNK